MKTYKSTIEKLLENAGISIDGQHPHDIKVHNENFYQRVLQKGSLGLGESYMEGWWDCEALDKFFERVLKEELEKKVKSNFSILGQVLKAKLLNQQTKVKSKNAISRHYDVGNDLYEKMLDPYMMYTCGFWENAQSLEEAQQNKMELICQKLKLKPDMEVLDIGCGWGGFAAYAAKNHNVKVTGITISKEQAKLAKKRCKNFSVDIKLIDYRDVKGEFDRILSIGMMEHVGYKNYEEYMEIAFRLLKPNGINLIHSIGSNETNISTDPWIDKYIFSKSLIPSMAQLSAAMEPYFVLEDLHNFGLHYDRTLMEWLNNFKASWPEIQNNYDEQFYRMWVYYLSSCSASFRVRKNNLWQLVMVKKEFPEEYLAVRNLPSVIKKPQI